MKPPAKPRNETPRPGVEAGDMVYFKLGDQHTHGKVVCHGAHGCTVDHSGGRARVYWSDVLGHKQRAQQQAKVVDKGEDGFLVEHEDGRRRFVMGDAPEKPREDTPNDHAEITRAAKAATPLSKALPKGALLIFHR